MFGQQPFGTAPSTGFSGFGSAATTTFGAPSAGTSLFGQSQPAQPTFGASTTFGGAAFGQPQSSNPFATTPAATGFGAATANPFGGQQTTQPAQSSGIFGNTGLFGSSSTQPAQNTFGQPQQPASTGLFGSSSTGGGMFGQNKPTFGATTTFGTQPASTSLFGSQQPSQSGGLFGSTTTSGTTGTGLFGQQSSSNLFGGMSQSQTGTTVKFAPTIGTDAAMKSGQQTNIQTKNYCICMMKEYNEQKSQEELRWEDYQAGRKFGNATTTSTGMFGASVQPSAQTAGTGLFGGGTSSGFGTSTGFGQPAAKPTGFGAASSGGLFGQPAQPTSTGFFGSSTATPTTTFGQSSIFGQTPASTSAPSMFGSFGGLGATTTAGSSAPAFGTSSAFGAPSTFGGFGQTTAPATTGLFGQPATTSAASAFGSFGSGSLFGAKPVTTTASSFGGFGQPTTSSTGFGGFPALGTTQPAASSGNLFGAGSKPAFGAATTSTPFGGFGTQTGFGGFGTVSTTQPSTSIFGQAAPASTGLFGTQPQQQQTSIFGGLAPLSQGSSAPSPSSGNIHAQVVEMLRHGVSDTEVFSNMYAHLPVKDAEKKAPLTATTINDFIKNAKLNYAPTVGSSRKDERTYNYYVAPTHKVDGLTLSSGTGPFSWRPANVKRDEKFKLDRACIEKLESEVNQSRIDTPRPVGKVSQIKTSVYNSSQPSNGKGDRGRVSAKVTPPVRVFDVRKAFDQDDSVSDLGSVDEARSGDSGDDQSVTNGSDQDENIPRGQAVFILKRSDYYTVPDKSELVLDGKGQCIVSSFYVGRYQCGGVEFLGETNVAGLNLDDLISISQNEVVVYPVEKSKPPVGKGLNKQAIITFENVRPESSDGRPLTKQEIDDYGFEEILRVRIATTMEDAEFLSYDAENGQVAFIVQHFSKYRLFLTKEDVVINKAKIKTTADKKESEDIRKKDISLLYPQKRRISDDGPSKRLLETKSPGADDSLDVIDNYFGNLPSSPEQDQKRIRVNERRTKRFQSDSGDQMDLGWYRIREPEVPQESDEQPSPMCEEKLPLGEPTRQIILEYGPGGKSVGGALAMGGVAGVKTVLGPTDGQFLSPFSILNDNVLSSDSKFHMEEMLQLYLSNCTFEQVNGEPIIAPPVIEKSSQFVHDFCRLCDQFPGDDRSVIQERIIWSLFHTLYGEPDLTEAEVCQTFLNWLRATLCELHPVYTAMDEIAPENVMKAIFEAVLSDRCEEAVDIALHFGLTDAASTILALWDPNEEESAETEEVIECVDRYLDQVMATVDDNTDLSVKYWARTLMLLRGIFCLNQCVMVEKFSICEGLDWLPCLAACALHLPQPARSAGLWGILRKYKEHASWDPFCSLPSQIPGEPPALILSMLNHYCRYSIPNMNSTLGEDLLADVNLDVRVKWFFLRLYDITGDKLDQTVELSITADFSAVLRTSGFPHVAVVTLLHLKPDTARRMEINLVLMSMVRLCREQPDLYQSLVAFFVDDLGVVVGDVENVNASAALAQGDKLKAFEHFYQAENEASCYAIMEAHVLPLMASSDVSTVQAILERFAFLLLDSECLQPIGAFFAMLRAVEEWRSTGEISLETQTALESSLELLSDSCDLFPRGRKCSDGLLDGFVRCKLRQAQAVLGSADRPV